jgi:hypothetical protein
VFRRVGESPREARMRARGRPPSQEQRRVAASLEGEGRADLAMAVLDSPRRSSIVPGAQYVTVVLTCGARHEGDHRAAEIHVDTYARYRTFEQAWGRDCDGPGTWQSRRDVERTRLIAAATDGHKIIAAPCVTCDRLVKINAERLAGLLRGMWSPRARTRTVWPPS